jgi:hypothetical protein
VSFLAGANLPWLHYGLDFGANAWQPGGGTARPERRQELRAVFARLRDAGMPVVRWFTIGDGRAGLVADETGSPVGLDSRFFDDADAALELLDEAGLRVVFVLVDFLWFRRARVLRGVRMHGRALSVRDPVRRRRLIDGVIAPFLARYGRSPVVAAWDVINEPEWATRGLGTWRPSAVSPRVMRAFVGDVVERVHALTSQPATVGSASGGWLSLVRGLGLDFYQVHWYDRNDRRFPLDRPLGPLALDRPCVLGEFPTKGSRLPARSIVAAARRSGYAGAWGWSLLAGDAATDRGRCESAFPAV